MASNLRVANVTSSGSGATLSDVTGPNGELGVRVTMGTGTFRLSAPQNFDIDLTKGNIEIDMRLVSNSANLGNGSAVSIVVSSGTSGGLSDVLATNNNRSVPIESKMRIHSAGTNMLTVCVPNNRIAVVANTGADMTHITGVRIGTNRTAATGAVFDIFGWRYRPNPRINDLTPIIFRFDGGSQSQYDYALPALQAAFGDASSAFLTFGKRFLNTTDFLTDAEFQDWLDAGAEFAPHGGFTTDNVQADRAAYLAEIGPHREWAKAYGAANGYSDLDHMSSFGTYYSSVGPSSVGFRQCSELDQAYRCLMQFTSAAGGSTPMQLGGAAFPPSRWNMECVSGNSWDDTGVWPTDADAITSIQAVMDAARANRSYACFAWHEGIDVAGRAQLCFTTVRDKILAEPTSFVAMGPNAMLDPYLTLYGGVI